MGDIIHTLPAFGAMRQRLPDANIEWLVDHRFREVLEEVDGLDRVVSINPVAWRGAQGLPSVINDLRSSNHDLVVDFQGLIKSALLSRLSGGRRIIGFSMSYVRERPAAFFYNETVRPLEYGHVIQKNFSLVDRIQCSSSQLSFPWKGVDPAERPTRGGPYAVLVPGASWTHKRWPARRFGELAFRIYSEIRLHSVIIHGTDDERTAAGVAAAASGGAATVSPLLSFHRLRVLLEHASIVIGGDTGPLHLASSLGVPTIGLFGPTNPQRNGPWTPDTPVVSRHSECRCKYKRRCTSSVPCITRIPAEEVLGEAIRTAGAVTNHTRA
jgi:lipopolysaccharide heptosyltransferase I